MSICRRAVIIFAKRQEVTLSHSPIKVHVFFIINASKKILFNYEFYLDSFIMSQTRKNMMSTVFDKKIFNFLTSNSSLSILHPILPIHEPCLTGQPRLTPCITILSKHLESRSNLFFVERGGGWKERERERERNRKRVRLRKR